MRNAALMLVLFSFLLSIAEAAVPVVVTTSPEETSLKKIFTTEDGLPQNTPTSLVQTRDGYIWIATYGGLARFDGLKFTVFTTSEFPALINNRLMALAEDSQGTLWIGSEDGDLMSFRNGVFNLVWKSGGEPFDAVIRDIYIDDDDLLWLGTDRGLKTYDSKKNQILRYPNELFIKASSKTDGDLSIRRFARDREGDLWMASNVGLIRFEPRNGQFTTFDESDGLPASDLWVVKNNPFGHVYFAAEGFFTFDGVSVAKPQVTFPGGFPARPDRPQTQVFMSGKDLLKPVEGGLQAYPLSDDILEAEGRSILFDREGNVWAGTQFNLIQFRKRVVSDFALRLDKVDEPTTCIIETPDRSIWVASRPRLIRFNKNTTPSVFEPNTGFIISLAIEPESGTLFVGTEKKILKLEGGKFVPFEEVDIRDSSDFVVFFDHTGTLWIGTKDRGLKRFRDGITQSFSTEEGLVSNTVNRIVEDSKGTIWIGTKSGLSQLKDGQFRNFNTDNGLTNNYVRDFYEDANGDMWVGTYGGGLLRYRDGVFSAITEANGLAENIVSRILADDDGNFWILGNRGIYSVSRSALNDLADGRAKRIYSTVYSKADGMPVSEGNGINPPSGWKTSDGKLWFPMIQGGVIIDPAIARRAKPPVYIERVRLDRAEVAVSQKLDIQAGEQNLEIDYTGITFTKPEQLQFRYKLEGFDHEWQEVGTRRVAYYPYLPPGTYTFRVTTATGTDINSENGASLEVIVNAPFWRTPWFFVFLLIVLASIVVAVYQFRLRRIYDSRIREQDFSRQLINAHESERHRIATELHDGIAHNLLIIRNWASLALTKLDKGISVRQDLEDIAITTANALDETRSISANLRPLHLQRFGLTSSIENMIETSRSSSRIDISSKVQNIDDLFAPEDELSIYRIVQESLNNVLKHSIAQNASVKIEYSVQNLYVRIADDGVGFETSLHDTAAGAPANVGLNNIRQRVKLLGGTFSIRSDAKTGTRLNVSVPIRKNES